MVSRSSRTFRSPASSPSRSRLQEMMQRLRGGSASPSRGSINRGPSGPVAQRGHAITHGGPAGGLAGAGIGNASATENRIAEELARAGIYRDADGTYHINPGARDQGQSVRQSPGLGGVPERGAPLSALERRVSTIEPGTVNGVPIPPGGSRVPPGAAPPATPPAAPATPSRPGAPIPQTLEELQVPDVIGRGGPQPDANGLATGGMPSLSSPAPPAIPPQGQGVGRTTTPTGAEVNPEQYPVTGSGPPPSPSAALHAGETVPGRAPASLPMPAPPAVGGTTTYPTGGTVAGMNKAMTPPPGSTPETTFQYFQDPSAQTPEELAVPDVIGQGGAQPAGDVAKPANVPDPGTQVLPSNPPPAGAVGPNGLPLVETPREIPPTPAPAATAPAPTPVPAPTPTPPPAQVPAQPGPATTPQVAPPGPGSSTPSRPGQPNVSFPEGFPFNGQAAPGMGREGGSRQGAVRDLSGLGQSIADSVTQRMANRQQGISPVTPGSVAASGLQGLGDRIRAAVASGRGEMPVGGAANLGRTTSDIMGRVRQQIAQSQVAGQAGAAPGITPPAATPTPTLPASTAPAAAPPAATPSPMPPPPGRAPTSTPPVSGTQSLEELQVPDVIGQGGPQPVSTLGASAPAPTPYPAPGSPAATGVPAEVPPTHTGPYDYMAGAPAAPTGTNWTQEAQQLAATPDNQFQYFQDPKTSGGAVGAPQGPVQAPLQLGNAQGLDWSAVNQYDAAINAAVAKYPEVDPAMVKAAIAMESQGIATAKNPASSSYGVLQIQEEYHRANAEAMGLNISDYKTGFTNPADDIMYWTALMAGEVPGNVPPGATPLERYANNYGTGDAYFQDINALMGEVHGAAPPAGTVPPGAAPVEPGSPGSLGMGGYPPTVPGAQGSLGQGQPGAVGTGLAMPGGIAQPSTAPSTGTLAPGAPVETTGQPVYQGAVYNPGEVAQGAGPPKFNTSLVNPETGYADQTSTFVLADPNPIPNYQPEFIVYHLTGGEGDPSTGGTNMYGEGSTNYMIGRDGTIWTYVTPGSATPLGNGAGVVDPNNPALAPHAGTGSAFDQKSVSVEVITPQNGELTPEQIAAGQYLTAHLSGQYGIPLDSQHIVGHSDVDGAGRGGAGGWDPYSTYDPAVMIPVEGNPMLPGKVAGSQPAIGAGQGVVAPGAGTTPAGGVHNTVAVPSGTLSAGAGQPVAVVDDAALNWVDGIVPGAEVDYTYNEDQKINAYGGYENWDCATCHTGVDIPTVDPATGQEGPAPFTAIEGGTVVCNVGGGNTAGPAPGQPGSGIGCDSATHIDPVTGVETPGMITIRTESGALVTYGHASGSNVALGDEVTPGALIGTSGNNNGYHVHQEVQLPIGPNGSYVLVDPSVYYGGGYCAQGFCPGGGTTPAAGTTPAPTTTPAVKPDYGQETVPAPAAAAPAAQPMPAPSYYASSTTAPTTGQVTTDAAGRQYETMADGSLRLIYDPAW